MKRGERQRFLVGTGHGSCTCEGAAFEYVVNLEFELRAHKVRDKADVTFITNEYELGDFGIDGVHIRRGGYITPSNIFTESLFAERGIRWITRAHVRAVEPGLAHYETLDGDSGEEAFDMAMLLPPFSGVGLKAFDRTGRDITRAVFAPNGFLKVDADYEKKPYEQWKASDWPRYYQSPVFPNLFAAGIAFAPPHAISRTRMNKDGVMISPSPPRTGMPSAMIGKAVARSIAGMLRGGNGPTQHRVDGGDGRGVRRLGWGESIHGNGSFDDCVPDCSGLRTLSGVWSRYRPDFRRDRAGGALDQDPAAPHVSV